MDTRVGNNIIECICRRYKVQTTGMIIEIESDKPLSSQLNAKLLEEEGDINEFFKYRKIRALRQIVRPPVSQIKAKDLEAPKILTKDGELSPRQRLNQLLKMKGEFTRQDYISYLFDEFKYKLNKWTSHNDIQDALDLHKIEVVDERKGRKGRVYRVINQEEIEEPLYKKLLQDRKLQISTLT